MYADYDYYQTEYGGKMSADDYKRFGRRAEDYLDYLTGGKLDFAFPTNEKAVGKVKRCLCTFADFIHRVDQYQQMAANSMGTVAQSDGTMRGRVVTSISSGSESIGYSATASFGTDVENAAKSEEGMQKELYIKAKPIIGGVPDSNGVNLLYAGIPYPRRNAPISRPPEDKPVEKPVEPTEPQEPERSEYERL